MFNVGSYYPLRDPKKRGDWGRVLRCVYPFLEGLSRLKARTGWRVTVFRGPRWFRKRLYTP